VAEDVFLLVREPLDKIRTHVMKALGALVYVEHFYKGGGACLRSRVFLLAVEL
jgi:hypothetical protein